MVTASFGNKKFEVSLKKIYTPSGVAISESIEIEEKEVAGGKPTTTVKAIKLMELSFDLKLVNGLVNVYDEVNEWFALLKKKEARKFTLGKHSFGTYMLKNCSLKEINTNNVGEWTSATLSLSFTQWNAAVTKTTTTTKSTNTAKATTVKTNAKKTNAQKISETTPEITTKSTIKPKKNVRWYATAEQAYKCKGTSGPAIAVEYKVYNTYKKNGVVVCVSAGINKGWLKIGDFTVVKY